MITVWQLARNDVAGALAYVKEHLSAYGAPPRGDYMAVLLQLQDDSTELERELAKILPENPAPPE
ncbi:MAG TPA: hypothetical protein VI072_11225 [Polyangiaceae bacterium]